MGLLVIVVLFVVGGLAVLGYQVLRPRPAPAAAAAAPAITTPAPTDPTLAPREAIAIPAELRAALPDLQMLQPAEPFVIPEQLAVQAVADLGVPFALSGEFHGKRLTTQAFYGNVTLGRWTTNPDGTKAWVSSIMNQPLKDGSTLERIENRPMWIITYDVPFPGPVDPTTGKQLGTSHTGYVVDATTQTVLAAFGYGE